MDVAGQEFGGESRTLGPAGGGSIDLVRRSVGQPTHFVRLPLQCQPWLRVATFVAPATQDIARDRASGIDEHAKERRRGIGKPPIDLLQGKYANWAERPNHVGGKRRGAAD